MEENLFLGKTRGFAVTIQLKEAADAIDAARECVAAADKAHSKGASCDVVVNWRPLSFRMSLVVARSGHGAMSGTSPVCASNRTRY
jgi:hypothetical protein